MIIAALVHKLGGSVTLTQLDFDEIAYKLLYENSCPSEKTFQLFLEKRSDEQAH